MFTKSKAIITLILKNKKLFKFISLSFLYSKNRVFYYFL